VSRSATRELVTFRFAAVILAAGQSSRMGTPKQLLALDGQPLVVRAVHAALASPAWPVVVVLGAHAEKIRPVLAHLPVLVADSPAWAEGMAASIRAGSLGASGSVMILPADMPELDHSDLQTLTQAFAAAPQAIWRGASARGLAGHPVIFPADLVGQLQEILGDAGARAVLGENANRIRLCPLAAEHALTDLDTAEDWAAWRAKAKPSAAKATP